MLYPVLAAVQHNIHLLQQEVTIAWKIHHPNIATVCGVTLEMGDKKKTAWIVMELLQGSLAGVIDASLKGIPPLSLREKVDMAHDSLCGLSYLHSLVGVLSIVVICLQSVEGQTVRQTDRLVYFHKL